MFLNTVKKYGNEKFLFQRNPENQNKYQGKTYKEVFEISKAIGSAILNNNYAPEINEWRDYKLRLVGIYS